MDFQFTAEELASLTAAALDYHMKGEVLAQSLQDRLLLQALEGGSKGFPGNKELITWRVKFEYATVEQGYSGDERVSYGNPAKIRMASAKWYERHAGIFVTGTELKSAGISVTDTTTGIKTADQKAAAATRLANVLEDKMDDLVEGRAISRSRMFWLDGAQNPKDVPGVTYWVQDNPTVAALVGSVDQALNPRWQNRAKLGIVANASNASQQILAQTLQKEWRQLKRYGGKPNKLFAGSDFLDQLENELRARGQFTETGWSKSEGQSIDMSVANPSFKGLVFEYEPELDDLGWAKRCYALELGGKGLQLMHMEGERDKKHSPAREADRYVFREAVTWTGALIAKRRNGCGVYSIA